MNVMAVSKDRLVRVIVRHGFRYEVQILKGRMWNTVDVVCGDLNFAIYKMKYEAAEESSPYDIRRNYMEE